METIICKTLFDITATRVIGSYRDSPNTISVDNTQPDGKKIWTRARNQQRNWETMNQIISLRCLPENITLPEYIEGVWTFEFDVNSTSALSDQPQDLLYLLQDAHDVPMITGLQEKVDVPLIKVKGTKINTWFCMKNP